MGHLGDFVGLFAGKKRADSLLVHPTQDQEGNSERGSLVPIGPEEAHR